MADLFLDITGDKCPMTFVKAKLKLESLQPGERLTIRLSGAEPLENVPRSLREEGAEVSEPVADGEAFRIVAVKT